LTFFTSYTDEKESLEVQQHSKIAKNYLKGFFIIDILSIVPLDYFFLDTKEIGANSFIRIVKIGKLYKILRLIRMIKVIKLMKN